MSKSQADAPLILAVPAKGRLQENAEKFFARAGLPLAKPRGARDYRGAIDGLDGVEVAYLSASEITQQLAQGAVHRCRRRGVGHRETNGARRRRLPSRKFLRTPPVG